MRIGPTAEDLNRTIPVGDLVRADEIGYDETGERFTYVSDSQDLANLCEYLPFISIDITGAFVEVANGDYVEVWVTESSRPYSIAAMYERII